MIIIIILEFFYLKVNLIIVIRIFEKKNFEIIWNIQLYLE
jgi:hypothetical protein